MKGRLRMTSCMAPNADAMCRELAIYLSMQLGIAIELVDGVPWQMREREFDAGRIDLCWICGLPYVDRMDRGDAIELCTAPVMRGQRYGAQAIYYSDVVVRADSAVACFDDLRGCTWAYNEPRSHSGYNAMCQYLAARGETLDYFGRRVEAGSHQAALRLILEGGACTAAIDSTVLEAELERFPELASRVRAITTVGPSPAPPWIFGPGAPDTLRECIRQCMTRMSDGEDGRRILGGWGIDRWLAVEDAHYDPIREMNLLAVRAAVAGHPSRPPQVEHACDACAAR